MKILLVEDEPSISGFVKKGLEENGYEVIQAFDGEMGQRLAVLHTYDVIILDLILPGINGLELCKKLRTDMHLDTPVLM